MISDPSGLEDLVAPIVIVPAAATPGAAAMDATSGGKSHVPGPKTPSKRFNNRYSFQNARFTATG